MDGNQLGAVREGGLDLNIGDKLRHAFHDVLSLEQCGAVGHEVGDAFSVARAFHDGRADKGDRFRVIEL